MIESLRLNPTYCLEKVNDECLLLISDSNSVVISSKVSYAILLEIAQQKSSMPELFKKLLQEGISHFETMQVLLTLKMEGYVIDKTRFFSEEQEVYWKSLGFNTELLADILQKKTIAVHAVGNADTSYFINICQETGITLSEKPFLQVVITNDYNHKDLAGLNQKFRKEGQSWVLVKTSGTEVWTGPVFIPGQTACWECLHHRLELHQPVNKFYKTLKNTNENPSKPTSSHPIAAQIGANMAVLELIKWLYNDEHDTLINTILSFDTKDNDQRSHTIVKRPQCPVCGNAEIVPPQPIILQKQASLVAKNGGYRSTSHQETLDKYQHHISNISGIVPSLLPYSRTKNTPIFNYSSGRNLALQSTSMFWLNQHLRSRNGGKGKTAIQAKTGALCEAIERYSLMYHGDEYSIIASLDELEEGIHPNICMNYSQNQLANREIINKTSGKFYDLTPVPFNTSEKMEWTPVYSLSTSKFKYLPACYCYAQYPAKDEKQLYAYPDSSGCAAGNNIEEAILQGFLELVERDAVAIWWYNRIKRPTVDLTTLNNPYLEEVFQYYQSIGRGLYVLDITSDLGIPVFVAISYNTNKKQEEILYAFGAHPDASIALERAITEVNQLLPIVLDDYRVIGDQVFIDWLEKQTFAQNDYLVPIKNKTKNIAKDYPVLCAPNIYDSLQLCLDITKKQGLETLVLNLTRQDVGLSVVRVMVPGLRHFWRRTAPGRLYDVPVKMGWLEKKLTEDALNPISIFV